MTTPETTPPPPGSYDDLYAHWGNPHDAGFEGKYIVTVPHGIGGGKIVRVQCHKFIAPKLQAVWGRLKALPGGLEAIKTYDGCYVVRSIRGVPRPSLHSWGLALDLNAATNGLNAPAHQPAALVAAFEAEGFFWGEMFHHRKDPMHFQYTKPNTI